MMRHQWTPAEVAVLVETYPHIPTEWLAAVFRLSLQQVYHKAASLGLRKSEAYLASEFASRLRRGDQVGASTRFRKGGTSWNKGRSYTAGGRSAETRFKPGHRGGKALENYKPVGSERLSKDGYLQRKINDDLPIQRRWRAVHLIEWEAIHGPVPSGHALVFKDGDKTNITLENLELIPRAELMRRNSYHQYPKPIARVIQLRGAITRQINKRERKST